jgi:predicted enzyme related to lactoylglutathione lyase
MEQAKKHGATIVSEPVKQTWGWYDAVIADFDGNEFVIEQKITT